MLLHHYYGYYRTAIQDALHRSRRKPFQCGGLQGYDQLVGIVAHVEQRRDMCVPDPYLNALETHLRGAIAVTRAQAEDVRQAHTFLRQVEHFLAHAPRPSWPVQEKTSAQTPNSSVVEPERENRGSGSQWVQQTLEQMFIQFARQPDVGHTGRRLCRKWDSMSQTWLPDILHCYDIPGLPRSNLELEAVYGALRANERRVSGHSETSPLRVFGAGEALALVMENEGELLEWCRAVAEDKENYRAQRRLHEEAEERKRWLRRLHRDPAKAMAQVDEQFYAVLKEQGLMPVKKRIET